MKIEKLNLLAISLVNDSINTGLKNNLLEWRGNLLMLQGHDYPEAVRNSLRENRDLETSKGLLHTISFYGQHTFFKNGSLFSLSLARFYSMFP